MGHYIVENGGIPVLKPQNKRFLYLLSGDNPSSYVRAWVYKEEFQKRNIQVDYFHLNPPKLIRAIKGTRLFLVKLLLRIIKKPDIIRRRLLLFKRINDYDVIIAVKYIKSNLLNKIRSKSNALLIYDFDDAVWLDMFNGRDEFLKTTSIVDCLTSDNSFLANYASVYNNNSFVLQGPCQVEKFIANKNLSLSKPNGSDSQIVIGWVGSAGTLFYLYKIYEALELIGERYPNVVLKLVGAGKNKDLIPPFEKIKVIKVPIYDQKEMIKQVYSFDIGVYPLFLNELSLGRGSLKATIYMSGGVPLVCSAIGENVNIIKDGENGFLADTANEWFEKLSLLVESPSLRKKMGESGFNFAESHYSVNSCMNTFLGIVEKAFTKD